MAKFQAGTATVQVIPDLTGFHNKLRRAFRAKDTRLHVPVEPKLGEFRKQMRQMRQQQEQRRIRLPVDGDTGPLRETTEKAKQQIPRTRAPRVPVDGDTSRLQRAAKRALDDIDRMRASVRVDADFLGVNLAKRAMDRLTRATIMATSAAVVLGAAFARIDRRQVQALAGWLMRAVRNTILLGSAFMALAMVPSIVGQIGAALVAASGAALLIPGALAAVGAAAATLVVGFKGMGDALKAVAEGDAKKLDEAMRKLAPSAQESVRAFQGLRDAFAGVGKHIQGAMWQNLAGPLRQLSQYAPVVKNGLGGIASEFNRIGHEVLGFANSQQTVHDFAGLLSHVRTILGNLGGAVRPLLAAFRDIGVVGSEVLAQVSGGAGAAAQRFADFIAQARQSGQLAEWMRGGIEAFKAMWQVIKDLGSIIASVFRAAKDSGLELTGALGAATGALAAFLRSAEGQTALKTFFDTIHQTVQAMLPGFQALGRALLDAFQNIAPVLPQVGAAMGNIAAAAAPVVQFLGELARIIIPVLSQVIGGLAPVLVPAIVGFYGIVKAAQGISAIKTFFAPVTEALAGLAGRAATTQVPVGGLRDKLNQAGGASTLFGRATSAASGALSMLGGPLGLVLGLVTLGGAAYGNYSAQLDESTQELLKGGQAAQNMRDKIADQTTEVWNSKQGIQSWTDFWNRATTPTLEEVNQKLDEHIAKLSPLEQAQARAKIAAGDHAQALRQWGEGSPQAIAAGQQVAYWNGQVAIEQGNAARATRSHAEEMAHQRNEALTTAQSQIGYDMAMQSSERALGQLNQTLATNSRDSLEARSATSQYQNTVVSAMQAAERAKLPQDQLAGAYFNLAQQAGQHAPHALWQTIGTLDLAAIKAWGAKMPADQFARSLIDMAVQAGDRAPPNLLKMIGEMDHSALSAAGARVKTNEFGHAVITLPNGKEVPVTAPHADESKGKVDNVKGAADRLPHEKKVHVDAETKGFWDKFNDVIEAVSGWIDKNIVMRFSPKSEGGIAQARAFGGLVEPMAGGGIRAMRRVAEVVPPNTPRLIGDRLTDDEAYIPINNSPRSQAILAETAKRMGYTLSKAGEQAAAMAAGGTVGKKKPEGEDAPVENVAVDAEQITAAAAALELLKTTAQALNTEALIPLQQTITTGVLTAFTTVTQALHTAVVPALATLVQTVHGAVIPALLLVTNTIHAALNPALLAIVNMINGLVVPTLRFLGLENILLGNNTVALQIRMQQAWALITQSITTAHQILTASQHAFANAMNASWMFIAAQVWASVNNQHTAFASLHQGLAGVREAMTATADWAHVQFRRVWDAASGPVRDVLHRVFNEGLIGAWNKLNHEFAFNKPVGPVAVPFATGGRVPGTGKRDTVPAMLTPGEYVLKQSAVRRIGVDTLEMLNNQRPAGMTRKQRGMYGDGGVIPGYAGGGLVWPMLWNIIRGRFPGAIKTSDYRPGEAGSYHGIGKAVDVAGGMPLMHDIQNWLIGTFGRNSAEIIGPTRHNIKNGRPLDYGPATTAQHMDHVHWAADGTPQQGGLPGFGIDPEAFIGPYFEGAYRAMDEIGRHWSANHMAGQAVGVGRQATDRVKAKAIEMFMAMGEGGGAGVERWRGLVHRALAMVGQPGTLADVVLRRMNQESKGDPRAINNWDINAVNGTPSKGLMQVIDPTFARHRHPALPNDIWLPLANVVASMRYTLATYGSLPAGYNRKGGYDQGGYLLPGRTMAYNNTGRRERVLTPSETRDYETTGGRAIAINVYPRENQSEDAIAEMVNRRLGRTLGRL